MQNNYKHIPTGKIAEYDSAMGLWYVKGEESTPLSRWQFEQSKDWEEIKITFTTEDGIELNCRSQQVFLVLDLKPYGKQNEIITYGALLNGWYEENGPRHPHNDTWKRFKIFVSRTARDEYIKVNTPQFTENDLRKVFDASASLTRAGEAITFNLYFNKYFKKQQNA